ncbi:MAG: hypothetical protein HGA36_01405 [Candidatus Moranbacteria bacterium]|nr:hypothetical protein [Candidatus Moranbacteria bacterium]
MKFDFKIGSKSKKPLLPAIGLFWQKIYKIIFLIFLLIALALGWYVWHTSLSGGEWSAEKKQEYLNSQTKGVVFNENNFKKVLLDIEERKQYVVSDDQTKKDIFKSY